MVFHGIFFFVLLGILKFLFRLTYAFVSIIFSSHVREKGRRFFENLAIILAYLAPPVAPRGGRAPGGFSQFRCLLP